MAKVNKAPSGRRRSDVVGRRRASTTVETQSRQDVLQRKQIAARVLLACYLIGAVLLGLGALFGVSLLSTGAEAGRGSGVGGNFTVLGTVLIVIDLFVVAFFLWLASKLWHYISRKQIHHIRRFSFVSFTGALFALALMAIKQGSSVLASTVSGGAAFFLVFFTIAALTAYATNRSIKEHL